MGAFDQATKYAAKADPAFVHRRVGRIAGLAADFMRWFPTKGVPLPGGPERDADLVSLCKAEAGVTPLLIWEFQSRHDPGKIAVLTLETMIFACNAGGAAEPGAPLLPVPVLVYLAGECPQRELGLITPNGFGVIGKPVVWEMAKDSARETLAELRRGETTWGSLFWVPLMQGGGDEGVIDDWLSLLDKAPVKARQDIANVAFVLSDLAGRRLAWARVNKEANMAESDVLDELLEMKLLFDRKRSLIGFLKVQHPDVITPDVERAIKEQPSLEVLDSWTLDAWKAKTGDEVLALLRR
jgi:hypothetical protein